MSNRVLAGFSESSGSSRQSRREHRTIDYDIPKSAEFIAGSWDIVVISLSDRLESPTIVF